MRQFYITLSILVFGHTLFSQSAISLGNSNMPGGGDTLRFTSVQANSIGNYTQTGTNFNWDFSTVVSTTEGRRDFKLAQQTPYALFFLLAQNEYGEKINDTLVGGTGSITITNYYNFYKKQSTPNNAFVADAVGITISGIPVPTYYSDKDELYFFPMTYPKRDSSTFKFSTPTVTLIPVKYSKQGYRITEVDGWGTVKTPYGTEPCLRLITTQYSQDTTVITIPTNSFIPIPIPPIKLGFQNYQRSYQWMTATSKIPYFEVTGNLVGSNFTITNARYRGFDKSAPPTVTTSVSEIKNELPLVVYPNPVKDKLILDAYHDKNFKASIFDVNGKLIKQENNQQSQIDVSGLEKGIYILVIDNGNSILKFCKFIKD